MSTLEAVPLLNRRILRLSQVTQKIGLAKSSIYAMLAGGDASFPKPIHLGARAVGWVESELEVWLEGRIAAARDLAA